VTTFVRELDAQGPAVVQRVSTVVGPLACSQDTIENIVDALHSGKSVTISADANGQTKSAAFNASGSHLGYGEAYIALALAAQELRNAGVTSCATPDQWQAVLLGGPLNTSVTSTSTNSVASAGSSRTFPGIVKLHSQGQGWGQIAQTNNLQLGQIISNSNSQASARSQSPNDSLSPTGVSSADTEHGYMKSAKDKDDKDHDKANGKSEFGKDNDKDKDDAHKSHDAVKDSSSATTPSGDAAGRR